jgi:hypothetical protein
MKAAQKQTNNDSHRPTAEAVQADRQNQLAQFVNNSKEAAAQRALMAGIADSPRMVAQRRQIEGYLGASQPRTGGVDHPVSSIPPLQPIQRFEKMDEEEKEVLQGEATSEAHAQPTPTATPNNTGLPGNLKSGIETLSGLSMDHVKVHYNSSQAAQLNALAYAQGTDIHIAPGQEQHLPHEAWHVVQQAQGRVKPTMQAKGALINDEQGLEREADLMGASALQMKGRHDVIPAGADIKNQRLPSNSGHRLSNPILQRQLKEKDIPPFREKVQNLLPTLPEEAITQIIKGSSSIAGAVNAAKKLAATLEEGSFASVRNASRSLVEELFSAYPPDSHHYILLGNSPALLENAIKEGRGDYSHLPLGGLTDLTAQGKTFGKPLEPGTERDAYNNYYSKSEKLQIYLKSFLTHIKTKNLVIIDYTQSGVSAIVAADLLTKASIELESPKTVKLFTFSKELPDDESALVRQTEYDLVSEAPLGDHERTFVTLTDTKAYKEKLGLTAYGSLKLHDLERMENPHYQSVLKELADEEGMEKLRRI